MKSENISSPPLLSCFEHNETNLNTSISDSSNNQEKINEQSEFNNFNISFFLPKELKEKIEDEEKPIVKDETNNGEQENYSVKNKINNNNLIYELNNLNNLSINKNSNNFVNFNLNERKDNSATQINNFNFININDFNNNFNLYNKNNNNNNLFINGKDNQNNFIKQYIPFLNANIFIPPIMYQKINNFYNFQINNYNPNNNYNFNYNQIQGKYNYCPNYYYGNNKMNKNGAQNTKIKKNKKIIDDYTLEMFGRKGWICKECNNFNYETRKKCNKCHINKKMKKLYNSCNSVFEENKELNNGNDWTCCNCGNLNYSFRLMCNRCKIKRDIQTI